MRYTILGFNQVKSMELDLDMTDLLLLDYIIRANGNPKMRHIVENEISYVWLSHAKIQEDLPILRLADGTLRNRLAKLKKQNLIMSCTIQNDSGRGSNSYYSVTELTMSLQNDAVDGPCHSKMTSNTLIKDYKEDNSNSINRITPDEDYNSHGYSENDLKEEFLQSKKRKGNHKNLFSKCFDEIIAFTGDIGLRDDLVEYLQMRINIKDKPIVGVNQWKGLLNKLEKLDGDKQKIVQQSIEKGWLSFYPLSDSRPRGYSEAGNLSCEQDTRTEEERIAEAKRLGMREKF